jgi:hypothetical protein
MVGSLPDDLIITGANIDMVSKFKEEMQCVQDERLGSVELLP